jgi:hypothetical protein
MSLARVGPSLVICLAVAGITAPRSRGEDVPLPRVTYRGALALPDTGRTADGEEVAITGLSGVTWLGDDRYACVMDNSHWLLLLRLGFAASGAPATAGEIVVRRLGERHDYEDVACPPEALLRRIAARRKREGGRDPGRCLLVCEENTPAIRVIAIESGELLGVVPLPAALRAPRPNRGLESLAVDPAHDEIWTATEEAVPADGPASAEHAGTVVRLARIGVPDGDGAPRRSAQFAYEVDPPHAFARVIRGDAVSGIVALVPLGAGRLLVLERSGGPGVPPFENRIYAVDTTGAADVSATERGLADAAVPRLAKRLLWRDELGCNVEGLCLGPPSTDGARPLVAVADNGGLRGPSQVLAFTLDDPAAAGAAVTSP